MAKGNFTAFVELIQNRGNLFGPVKVKDRHSYELIKSAEELDFDFQRTVIGPKKFLTPPKYKTLSYNKEGKTDIFPEEESKNFILGVHPCDIHGIKILDRLYLGNIKDPYYAKRRKNLILIGHSCLPDDKCVCKSTGTDMVEDGFDLFLTDLGEYYLIWVGSDEGLTLTIAAEHLLSEDIEEENIQEYVRWQQRRSRMFESEIPFRYMADIITLNYDSDVWEQFGEKCLSCGTCSMVCPTCNCFNVDDTILMNADEGVRERMMDSCTLPYYSRVAGDHDFRPDRTSRLKLYYTHKLKEYIGRWGQPGCVGCGRCITFCPVDINVLTVSNALFGEVCETEEACDL